MTSEVITGEEPAEYPNPAIAELIEVRDEYVAAARRASRAQVDLWRQIPWLALQVEGRDGYNDDYGTAYEQGYWNLRRGEFSWAGASQDTGVSVDLETGMLIDSWSAFSEDSSTQDEPRPASDANILKVLAAPEQLDAAEIIKSLKAQIERPGNPYASKTPEEQVKWRRGIINRLRLEPIYSRRKVVTPGEPFLLEPQVRNVTPIDATS